MATSGSKSVSVGTGATLKFEWSQSSQSVSNNTTTISWTMKLIMSSGYSISSSASKDWSVTVNGSKYSGSNTVGVSAGGTKTLASGSTTIGHNSDGTKTFSYSFSQEFAITYNGSSVGTKSGSGSGTLNTIARASSISGGTGNIGSNVTITISRASNSFTHTLTYSFGSLSGTIATKTTSTSVSWTIPTSFYAQIPNAKSGTGTIKCETFNGSTSIGSKSISFTAKVTGSEPTLNPQAYVASDSVTASLTGSTTKFIKYFTSVTVSTGASARNSATLKSQSVTCGGKSITTASGTIANVESGTFTFSATDSRGYTTTQTLTRTLVNYVNPTIAWSSINITTDGVATLKVSGVCFNGSFGAVNNTISVQYRYRTKNGTYASNSWENFTITQNGNNYTGTATLTGLSYQQSYVFQAWVGDKFFDLSLNEGVYANEKTVRCVPVFDWGESDFRFNVDVQATGYIWSKDIIYTDKMFCFNSSPNSNGRMGYSPGSDTDKACVYISNGNNNWLRLNDDTTITYGGNPIAVSTESGALSLAMKNASFTGNIYLPNNQGILCKNTSGENKWAFYMDTNNRLCLGYDGVNTKVNADLVVGGGNIDVGTWNDNYNSVQFKRSNSTVGGMMTKIGVSWVDNNGGEPAMAIETGLHDGTTYTLKRRYRFASTSISTDANNTASLGTSGVKFTAVYATNGTIQTSDARYKYILEDINSQTCYDLIKDMNLYGYSTLNKRIDEYVDTTEISDELQQSSQEDMNLHMGFVAQEIEDSELAKYILIKDEIENGEHIYGVDNYAYTTAIHGALQHEIELRDAQIEELKKENEDLKEKNQELEERIVRLEKLLTQE